MINFCISLADIPIGVNVNFASTRDFCDGYFTKALPVVEVSVSFDDIAYERCCAEEESKLEKKRLINYSDEYLETLALYRKIVEALLIYDTLLFHGSAVAIEDRAYIFSAKSGTGKTTHTRLWLKNFPMSYVVNGDKPLIRFKQNDVVVCGTPWCGKEGMGNNCIISLKAICFLQRGYDNFIEELSFCEGLPELIAQCYRPNSANKMKKTVELISKLKNIQLYRMHCNMNDDAAFIAYNAMERNNG